MKESQAPLMERGKCDLDFSPEAMKQSRQGNKASEGRQQNAGGFVWSEAMCRALVEHSSDVISLIDMHGVVLYQNPSCLRVLGFTPDELTGRNALELVHLEDRERLVSYFLQLLESPEKTLTGEFRHVHKDGSYRWMEGVGSNMLADPTVRALVLSYRDITQRKEMEKALREGESYLRVLTETLPAVPWSATPDGQIDYFSDRWLEWTGLSREQALGAGWKLVVHPDDLAPMLAAAARSVRTGAPFDIEHRLRRLGGTEYRWYHSRALPQHDEQGRIIRWHGLTDDIHEVRTALEAARQNEQQLRESEQGLRLAIETAALGSYERDLVTNTVRMNQYCREILGVPEGPPDPQVARKSLYPADRERVLAEVTRAFDPARREVCGAEFRIVRPDGQVRWVAGQGRVIFDDSVEPPRGLKFMGVLHDITQRKQAEQALQHQNQRLSLLNEVTANLLLAEQTEQIVAAIARHVAAPFELDGILEFIVSDSGQELELVGGWGVGQEMCERGFRRLQLGESPSGNVALQRQPRVIERLQACPDPQVTLLKELRVQAYACYPLLLGERLLGTIGFASRRRESFSAQDQQFFETLAGYVALAQERARLTKELRGYAGHLEQTVEERTSRLREMVTELEHMSYTMVHDLRAPLRAMSSYAQLLLQRASERLQDEEREFLQRIVASAHRMDHLVTDALNYNKTLRQQLPLGPVDPAHLLAELLRTNPDFQSPRATLRLEGAFPLVFANPEALTQCFSRLLENAVKFVAPGTQPEIRLWAESCAVHTGSSKPEPGVRLWFEDNGLGIPQENRERIFDMFHQVHVGFAGTGIGLALVRKLVDRMGGRVGVESEEGHGSRFWLELKAA